MNKKWVFILIAGALILTLAACAGGAAPTILPEGDTDADTSPGHDDDTEAASDTAEDHDDDDMVEVDAASLYTGRCAGCHGDNREGDRGPALLPDRLDQDPSVYENIITNGSGSMPSWSNKLSADEISALVDFIFSEAE